MSRDTDEKSKVVVKKFWRQRLRSFLPSSHISQYTHQLQSCSISLNINIPPNIHIHNKDYTSVFAYYNLEPIMATEERSFKTQDFTVPSNGSGETIQVRISEPNLTSENLGLETWAASHILASQLHHIGPKIQFPTPSSDVLPILELGAGTGLVGVTAATLWKQPVVLTDLAPLVPALDANIDLNSEGLRTANTHMEAGTLDWKHPTTLIVKDQQQPQTQAHVIFAADTIYSEEHPELLANVILKWLVKDKEARFIIAYPLRVCYIDYIREMWERLEEGGMEAFEEGREEASQDLFNDERLVEWSVWRWKDI